MIFEIDKLSQPNQETVRAAGFPGKTMQPGIICYTRRPVDTYGDCVKHNIPFGICGPVNHLRYVENHHPCWRSMELVDKCDKNNPNLLRDRLGGYILNGESTKIQVTRSKSKTDLCPCSSCRNAKGGKVLEDCDYRGCVLAFPGGK